MGVKDAKMTKHDIYLFDVNHGQCLAIRGDSGNWYIFDLGSSETFSPVAWMQSTCKSRVPVGTLTISHFHGDHIYDIENMGGLAIYDLSCCGHDSLHMLDCASSNSAESMPYLKKTLQFIQSFGGSRPFLFDDDGIRICQEKLSLAAVREIGGSAGNKVNNASVVSRIEINGFSILACGDMEKSGWDYIFSNSDLVDESDWRDLVTNIADQISNINFLMSKELATV
jgi:hypothetical protein